uniref:Cytochrome c oxidase subunit 2 n=3 Tax=Grylloblatta TaxID=58612 RepID=Q09T53_9NEOP|nr:cytochrome oxidase subunit II [Grylloblatta gurneyi]ABF13488.1 cytochrome oxidase subunit II [Grylloblatta gurneyi]ABF13489.1 cytochrome oxidase subunit II [Grylloblatta gurneyi]
MATWMTLSLQDSSSPMMEQLIFFHDHTLLILTTIVSLVSYLMGSLFFNTNINRNLLESQTIEMIWTITPAIILFFIAVPSLRLLYLMDEINNPAITLKTVGHQWYWSYEYSDFSNIEFDAYMIPLNEMENSSFRLLDVDNRITLPMNTHIRMIVTAADVLHSWTIPSIGVKVDATPGRLNQMGMLINRPGLFYGQCSEICGANHSFMPIVMESVKTNTFISWISQLSES